MAERRPEGGVVVGGGSSRPADEGDLRFPPALGVVTAFAGASAAVPTLPRPAVRTSTTRARPLRQLAARAQALPRPGPRGTGRAVVVLGCLAVRAVLWAAGTRFSTAALRYPSQWQLLDASWLRDHPLAPLWDLHTQPPLFNVLVGSVLAWSPLPDALSFQLLYTGLTLVSAVLLHELLTAFGARRAVAAVATVVAFADPVLVDYEHMVLYESLITALVLGMTWACHRYATTPSLGRLSLLLGLATTLVLTRALFHPLWLALAAALVMALRPPRAPWRRTAVVAAVPLLLVVGLMAKNQVRFGTFSLSSWFGMNLDRTIVDGLPLDEKEALIAEGTLSPQARVTNFSAYDAYRPHVPPCRADHGSAALDAVRKRDGSPNYNHACYLPIYEQAGRDAVAAARARPGRYARSIGAAFVTYLADQPTRVVPRSGPADVLDTVHDALALEVRVTAPYPTGGIPQDVHLTALVALVGLVGAGGVGARRAWQQRRSGEGHADDPDDGPSSRGVTLAFVGFTLLFATTTGAMFELWENARFRLPLDPLLFGATVAVLGEVALRAARREPRPARAG